MNTTATLTSCKAENNSFPHYNRTHETVRHEPSSSKTRNPMEARNAKVKTEFPETRNFVNPYYP